MVLGQTKTLPRSADESDENDKNRDFLGSPPAPPTRAEPSPRQQELEQGAWARFDAYHRQRRTPADDYQISRQKLQHQLEEQRHRDALQKDPQKRMRGTYLELGR